MRRVIALAILLGLVSAPALRIWCEWSCNDQQAPAVTAAAPSHCHETATTTDAQRNLPQLASADACNTHVVEGAAVLDGRNHRHMLLSMMAGIDDVSSPVSAEATAGHHRFAGEPPPSPPHTRSIRILRI